MARELLRRVRHTSNQCYGTTQREDFMKLITAIIKPLKLDETSEAL